MFILSPNVDRFSESSSLANAIQHSISHSNFTHLSHLSHAGIVTKLIKLRSQGLHPIFGGIKVHLQIWTVDDIITKN